MSNTYVYFYFMKNEPEKLKQIVHQHIKYWNELKLNNYAGGPFADRSGGLITFTADNIDKAADIINKDPFIEEDLLSDKWIKEWLISDTPT